MPREYIYTSSPKTVDGASGFGFLRTPMRSESNRDAAEQTIRLARCSKISLADPRHFSYTCIRDDKNEKRGAIRILTQSFVHPHYMGNRPPVEFFHLLHFNERECDVWEAGPVDALTSYQFVEEYNPNAGNLLPQETNQGQECSFKTDPNDSAKTSPQACDFQDSKWFDWIADQVLNGHSVLIEYDSSLRTDTNGILAVLREIYRKIPTRQRWEITFHTGPDPESMLSYHLAFFEKNKRQEVDDHGPQDGEGEKYVRLHLEEITRSPAPSGGFWMDFHQTKILNDSAWTEESSTSKKTASIASQIYQRLSDDLKGRIKTLDELEERSKNMEDFLKKQEDFLEKQFENLVKQKTEEMKKIFEETLSDFQGRLDSFSPKIQNLGDQINHLDEDLRKQTTDAAEFIKKYNEILKDIIQQNKEHVTQNLCSLQEKLQQDIKEKTEETKKCLNSFQETMDKVQQRVDFFQRKIRDSIVSLRQDTKDTIDEQKKQLDSLSKQYQNTNNNLGIIYQDTKGKLENQQKTLNILSQQLEKICKIVDSIPNKLVNSINNKLTDLMNSLDQIKIDIRRFINEHFSSKTHQKGLVRQTDQSEQIMDHLPRKEEKLEGTAGGKVLSPSLSQKSRLPSDPNVPN